MRGVGGGGVLSFAGRGAPRWWCDGHHLLAWALGGQTSLENSGLRCERHHTQVHHGYRVERQSDGRRHTYRPDGTQIRTLAARAADPAQALARTG